MELNKGKINPLGNSVSCMQLLWINPFPYAICKLLLSCTMPNAEGTFVYVPYLPGISSHCAWLLLVRTDCYKSSPTNDQKPTSTVITCRLYDLQNKPLPANGTAV